MNYRIFGLVLGLLFAPLLAKAQDTAFAWTPNSRVHVAASGGVYAHTTVTYTGTAGVLEPAGTHGTIIGGPRFNSGWTFWAVQWDNSIIGWSRQFNIAMDSLAVVACNCTIPVQPPNTTTVTPPPSSPPPSPTTTPLYTLGNGANYYAAPSGSDANACTQAAPCYTMQRVSQLMNPGDNAHFAPGNYTWTWTGNRTSKNGTAAARITYISDTKWGAKAYAPTCDPIYTDGDYVQIINFDVTTGSCPEGINVNGNYDRVIGNRVHDLPGSSGGVAGILGDCCNYHKTGIEIIGNVVDNIAMGTGSNIIHGIYTAGPNSIIENNIVTRASAACITHYHGGTHSIVSNNIVANCKYGIQIAADGAITSDDYTTVDNNIVVNNGRGIYEYPTAGPHNVYNNNIVYNSSVANFDLCCGGTQSNTLVLTSTQFSNLFVNYTGNMNGDYHLKNGAIAIDAGTTNCAAGITNCVPLWDYDGVKRPVGTAYDIGPYEVTSSVSTLPLPSGPTVYVAPAGNNAVSCAQAQNIATPKQTLNNAIGCLTPGTTLLIRGGTYAEALLDNIPTGTSWVSPITLKAYPGETVTLKPNAGPGWVLHFQNNQSYIIIDGLILDAANVSTDGIKITYGSDPTTAAHHIRIINDEIKNAPSQGILISGPNTSFNEFINLKVHDNGGSVGSTNYNHGIYISSPDNLVDGCDFYNNATYGVQVYSSNGGANNNIVRNTKSHENNKGMVIASGSGSTAYNNVVYGNRVGGLTVDYGVSNVAIYNNTFYNNGGGIYIGSGSANAIVRNNVVWQSGTAYSNAGSGTTQDHNLWGTSDPRFVNAAAGDFHLQPGSPAIDTGAAILQVSMDLDSVLRPQGVAYDIGAYEGH